MNRLLLAALVVVAVALLPTGAEPDAIRRRVRTGGKLKLPHICDLEVGKGTQVKGTPVFVRSSRLSCYESCQRLKRRRKNIIGVATWVKNVPNTRKARENKCHCLKADNGGFTVDPSQKDWKTCMFYQKGKPKPAMKYVQKKVCSGLGSAFVRKGCYSFAKRGRYLVNRRLQVEWARRKHTKFACDFVGECAKAAKAAGVMYFATHFYGECWEVKLNEGKVVAGGEGCSLADGLYKSKCVGTDLSHECLGSTNYYVYSIAVPRG